MPVFGFRVWSSPSCRENKSPQHNDFYFSVDGGLEENRAATIAARCLLFVQKFVSFQITIKGCSVFPAPLGAYMTGAGSKGFYTFATGSGRSGSGNWTLPERPYHLHLRKWCDGPHGGMMLYGGVGDEHVLTNAQGKIYLSGTYPTWRIQEEWDGLIASLETQAGAVPIVAEHAPNYESLIFERRVRYIKAQGVSELNAVRRSGLMQPFDDFTMFPPLAETVILKAQEHRKFALGYYDLDLRFNDWNIKEKANIPLGMGESLGKLMQEKIQKIKEKSNSAEEFQIWFRFPPFEPALSGAISKSIENKCKAWQEQIDAMEPDIVTGVPYVHRGDVKAIADIMMEMSQLAMPFVFVDAWNPYLILPPESKPSGQSSDEERKLLDEYFDKMKKFPSKCPLPPADLIDVYRQWENWRDEQKSIQHAAFKIKRGW